MSVAKDAINMTSTCYIVLPQQNALDARNHITLE